MPHIALFTAIPIFCPICGAPIDVMRNQYTQADWFAHCSHTCLSCGLSYQLVDEEHALAAATASGGDLAQWH